MDVLKYVLVFSGLFFLLISLFQFQRKKDTLSLIFLTCSSLCIFLFSAFMFDFLNPWDERFHALVAKNLLSDPFTPTLYKDPVVLMDYNWWNIDHVWLHKQPLFLWQMALSMKMFGVNVVAIRIPSVILATLLVVCGYRIGKLVSGRSTGYITATLLLSSQFLLLLVSGYGETDHNDVTFVTYISFSTWTWLEYRRSKKWYWLVLTGIFSGCAVLTKWLVGLYVYLIWGLYLVIKKQVTFRNTVPMLLSLGVTALVSVPWQVYTNLRFPEVAKREHNYNFQHLVVPVDGHDGSFFYHIEAMNTLFGPFTLLLILPAMYFFIQRTSDKKLGWAILGSVVLVYLFFSISATKMPSFPFVLAVPVFLFLASMLDTLLHLLKRVNIPPVFVRSISVMLLLGIMAFRFGPYELSRKHGFFSSPGECSKAFYKDAEIFRHLHLPPNSVLFNVKAHHYIEAMFHTDFPAYNFMPSKVQYEDLLAKNRLPVILKGPNDEVPTYLLTGPSVLILEKETAGCD